MYKLILAAIVMFSLQASAEQTCTVEYLGRDSQHAAEGEPSVDIGSNKFPFNRVNEDYGNPNVFRWILPMINATENVQGIPFDIFEITCVDE